MQRTIREVIKMPAKIQMSGKKYGRLTVKEESGRDKSGQVMWKCECDCGKICYVRGRDLRSGNTKSCGCMDIEKATETIRKQTVEHSNPAAIKTPKISTLNTSGTRGVCPTKKGLWRAYIGHKGELLYLGEYADIADAIKARKMAEDKYYKPIIEEMQSTCS